MPVVVIIDDCEDNLELFALVLREAGFIVHTAQDGIEGVRLVEVEQPDAVVVDLAMPHMDGFETIERLRSTPSGESLYVVVASACADRASRERATAVGANFFVAKPCAPTALVEAVRFGVQLLSDSRQA